MNVRIHEEWDRNGWGVYLYRDNGLKGRSLARPVKLVYDPVALGDLVQPTFLLDGEDAKALLHSFANELGRLGYVPEGLANKEEALRATQAHLWDLQRLLKLPEQGRA